MAGPEEVSSERTNSERMEHAGSMPLALLVAVIIGAAGLWLALGRNGTTESAPAAGAPVTISSAPSAAPLAGEAADVGPGYQLLGGADQAGRTVSFVRLPMNRGATIETEIYTLLDGELVTSSAGRELTSLGQIGAFYSNPGERRDYILATSHGTILTNLGLGQFVPYDAGQSPVSLGEGFSLLAGPDESTVWLLTSAERWARLVELNSGREVLSVDLATEGRPMDSAGGGLIVIDDAADAGFALWTPDHGRRAFAGTAGAVYVGAAADTVVFAQGDEFLVMDLDDPGAAARRIPNPEPAIYRTTVSPDGALVAASAVTSITEPNRIVILDLADGTERNRVTSSLEVLFQWSSPTRLFYLRPDWPAFDLVERNISSGVDANVLRLEDLSWWYTAVEQPDDDATLEG